MSDEYTRSCWRFEREIRVTEPELHYAAKKNKRNIVCTLELPYPLLKKWHEIVQSASNTSSNRNQVDQQQQGNTSATSSDGSTSPSIADYGKTVSYINLVEYCIPGGFFVFTDDENIRNRINESLSKIAGGVTQLYKKTKGRGRKDLDERISKSVTEFSDEIESMKNELMEWKQKYKNLEEDKKEIFEEMVEAINKKDKLIGNLQKQNKELEEYADCLTKAVGITSYQGKPVSEVKNKTRTLKTFLSKAKIGLWFSSSFGLQLESLVVKGKSTGQLHMLKCCEGSSILTEQASTRDESDDTSKYKNLPQDEKDKIEQILFLIDKFCVGDAFYHELTMTVDGLPRSYLIKQCRNEMNKMCHLEALKGSCSGAKVTSVEDILREHVMDYLQQNPAFNTETDKIQIKISGDGAKMTNNSNFILLSFSVLQTGENVMSAKGNRTIAIVNGKEDYATMKESFGDVIAEINKLVAAEKLSVEDKDVNTEFFLGGDYKFILMLLGLKGAVSNYACAWCKVHKNDRWKMDHHYTYFNTPPLSRTLKEIQNMCKKSKDNYCFANPPLFNNDLDHIVVDELHLLLRVTDILVENIVYECIDWDKSDQLDHERGAERGVHLRNLVETIKSCGVSFNVWEKRDVDGKSSGHYDWTSLLGSDKKLLLTELPLKMAGVLQPDTTETVVKIWTNFESIYRDVNNWTPGNNPTEYWIKARDWVKLFLSLNGKREGYERKRITPYIHIMVQHIPKFFELHSSVKIFTGQGVEKNNDVARSVVLRKSNKWDSAGDVLRQEQRQWELRKHERMPRDYTKNNESYWKFEIKENRQKRKRASFDSQLPEASEEHQASEDLPSCSSTTGTIDYSTMTISDLRQELKSRNIKGFSRKNKAQLIEQLKQLHQDEVMET